MIRFKLTLPLIITVLIFSVSCKKDYTCDCTYINVISEPGVYSFEIEDSKKKDANDACESFTFAGWTEIQCKLK